MATIFVKNKCKSAAFNYFEVSEDDMFFVCTCEVAKYKENGNRRCGAKIRKQGINGKRTSIRISNLKRHLERFHPIDYEHVIESDKSLESAKLTTSCFSNEFPATESSNDLRKYVKNKAVNVVMTAEIFKKGLINLVVFNNIPLYQFSQSGFQILFGEIANNLNISLDRSSLRNLIINEANIRKEELRNKLQGKHLFLKMDGATRHRTNYFAINVRYYESDCNIVTNTLAIRDTQSNHGSIYLQQLIESVLKDYGIEKSQIIAIVTDNASNMVKTVKMLNEDNNLNFEENSKLTREILLLDDIEIDGNIDDLIDEASGFFKIRHMRCATHTLQLAIRDGIKQRDVSNLISKARQVALTARTPKIDAIIKRRAIKGAILDQDTRWGSTYLMIKRLLELKNILEDIDIN